MSSGPCRVICLIKCHFVRVSLRSLQGIGFLCSPLGGLTTPWSRPVHSGQNGSKVFSPFLAGLVRKNPLLFMQQPAEKLPLHLYVATIHYSSPLDWSSAPILELSLWGQNRFPTCAEAVVEAIVMAQDWLTELPWLTEEACGHCWLVQVCLAYLSV